MPENTEETKNIPDLSTLFNTLISNPEAMAKISGTISKFIQSESDVVPPQSKENPPSDDIISPSDEENNANDVENPPTSTNSDFTDALSKLPSLIRKLSTPSTESSFADKQQIALLLAIRPYLSPHRKELIDTFIKMNKFSAIFMSLNEKGEKNVL